MNGGGGTCCEMAVSLLARSAFSFLSDRGDMIDQHSTNSNNNLHWDLSLFQSMYDIYTPVRALYLYVSTTDTRWDTRWSMMSIGCEGGLGAR